MSWQRPDSATLWKAIDIYLRLAYTRQMPPAVQARLQSLHSVEGDPLASSIFEHDQSADPARFALRLGNEFYPHMKLMVERSPDGQTFLFRADTHDRHICPDPASKDYPAYCALCEKNQILAQSIESTWADHDLPTFKTFLKNDLARRAAAAERS